MRKTARITEFENQVEKKFNLYSSLFLSLPFQGISDVGHLIPILQRKAAKGLLNSEEPLNILNDFFAEQTDLKTDEEKINLMFKVIQYIERLVVLYDSIEDAAFIKLNKYSSITKIKDQVRLSRSKSKDVLQVLNDFKLRLVLTAHPTQFYPPSVLDIIDRLRNYVEENNIEKIDLTLRQLGITSLMNINKPTPYDEARNIIYFLRNVHYNAIGKLYSDLKKNLNAVENYDLVSLGFWPGGDRDGNPFVDHKTTAKVAEELRITIMKCYYHEVKALEKLLTFKDVIVIISELRQALYDSIFSDNNLNTDQILNPLNKIRELLINNFDELYLDKVEELIYKVNIFKTHFVSLDIRQHHKYHENIIQTVLIKNGIIKESINELNKKELIDILLNKEFNINENDLEDPIEKDTILNIRSIINIQNKNGENACNRYIISNSEDIFSVLFVYSLFKNIHFKNKPITFDIVPLFESMDAMANSEEIMKELLELDQYRNHLNSRNNKQTIMLGFSDGTKDGGYIKANWSIFRTKERLTQLCKKYDIDPIFFDGRGGPPSRGGGKTYRFYAAHSSQISHSDIQLTIQGQTITSKYGIEQQFIHNCHRLINAGIDNGINSNKLISKENRELIEQLAESSFKKYVELKNHPVFIPYLENKSTLKYFSRAKIGSRPAKRGQNKQLTLDDLRAISYVSSWSQLKQNVPGYYGIGSAIYEQKKLGNIDKIKTLFKEVPVFKSLMQNSMMVLTKTNFELTSYLGKNKKYGEFWKMLFEEYKLTKEMLLEISGYTELMEEELMSKQSIKIREGIVLPLLLIQQYALQKIELHDENKDQYEKIVERSLYGNINASRNSV